MCYPSENRDFASDQQLVAMASMQTDLKAQKDEEKKYASSNYDSTQIQAGEPDAGMIIMILLSF